MRKVLLVGFGTAAIAFSCIFGILGGFLGTRLARGGDSINELVQNVLQQDVRVVNQEEAIIAVADKAKDSVVSIVVTKDLPKFENSSPFEDEFFWDFFERRNRNSQPETETREIGAGTGFIISADGMIVSNRHVVDDEDASYTVVLNNGEKYNATILAVDTLLDIAFIKIDAQNLTPLNFGSSENLKVGQTVIAIGNALGEFSNTVSSGIISGLKRDITASDATGSNTELLDDVIQTDASINLGNSGGPLLDIKGNVIGVNVAIASNAQNIGFAIPSDVVVDLLNRLNENGEIERPILGVRFRLVTESLAEANNLRVDYGALIIRGETADDLAVIPGSPADKAGLRENDIILEIDGERIDESSPLQNVIQRYRIDDEITLKVLRQGNEIEVKVKLEKF